MPTARPINASPSQESFLVLFFKKEQAFFCEQSCESAPDAIKQKTSSIFVPPQGLGPLSLGGVRP
jgi:hypothetical protein